MTSIKLYLKIGFLITVFACIAYLYVQYSNYKEKANVLKVQYDELSTVNEQLKSTIEDKEKSISDLKKEIVILDSSVTEFNKTVADNKALLDSSRKSLSDKEKELLALKKKFYNDNPSLVGDKDTELIFLKMESSIRITSLNEIYCKLYTCQADKK